MSFRETVRHLAQKQWLRHYLPNATLPAHSVDCPECGLRVHLPKLRQGQQADCTRCGHDLVRIEPLAFQLPVACAVAALIFLGLVYSLNFAEVIIGGISTRLTLPEMVSFLMWRDFGFLGGVLLILTFGTPVLFLLLIIYVYGSLYFEDTIFPYQLYATRVLTRLNQWVMVDVFFLSALVADIKMSSVAKVTWGTAFWIMPLVAILLLRASKGVPIHWVYYQIQRGEHQPLFRPTDEHHICCTRCLYFRPKTERDCGVCGSALFNRRPRSLWISFCFLLAATILYLPANFLPIMISANPTEKIVSTIMSGIILMWEDGDRLIASIIFSASVLVPSLKIVSMAILLWSARFQPALPIRFLSWQYRLTEAIGRWSMIDIFVIIILMSAFHTPLAKVTPAPAAFYFCVVVLLTMWSAYFFDMRLIWDKTPIHKLKN